MDNPTQLTQFVYRSVDSNLQLATDFTSLFTQQEFSPDDYFLCQGQPVEKIGFLTKGIIRIFTTDLVGEEYNIVLHDEGSFVMGSFMPEKISDVNIQCITPSIILVADFYKVIDFLETNQKLKSFLNSYLSAAHQRIQHRLTQYLRLDAKGRYLSFLSEYPNLINKIPHYHIANYLGISTTQLSRIRHKLAKG